jgi:ribosome recycling factor
MKIIRYITLLTLSFYLPLNANEMGESVTLSVQNLLLQVKQAPDSQKRVLMNQLKMQLKKMNTESRKEVMRKLKKSFGGKGMQHRRGQRRQHDCSHTSHHQPKFRHLQQGLRDGSGARNGHQGNGHK